MQSFLLIFPPAVESAFFPYLSLPALTAFLRERGAQVQQVDLNLLFLKELLGSEVIELLILSILKIASPQQRAVRMGLLNYVKQNPGIWHTATTKDFKYPVEEQNRAILVIKRMLDLTLEQSVLGLESPKLTDSAESILQCWKELYQSDPGVKALIRALELIDRPVTPPTVVGISVPFYSQILPALVCSTFLCERYPQAIVIWGGPQIWLHLETLKKINSLESVVHALCYGQGEPVFEALCYPESTLLINRTKLPNLVWTSMDYANPSFEDQVFGKINDLPTPDFSDFDPSEYLSSERVYPLITCLGCYWGKCTFCSYGNRYHRVGGYQELSVGVLVSQCIELIERYNAKKILFVDENCNLKLIARAARRVVELGYKFSFTTRNRLEKSLLNIKFCEELKALGCELMAVGYETNSQRLLDKLQRGVDRNDFQTILDNLSKVGIPVRMSVMGGILDETHDEMQTSFEFLTRNSQNAVIDSFQTMIVEPKTPLADQPNEHGVATLSEVGTGWNEKTNFGLGRVGHHYTALSNKNPVAPIGEAHIIRTYSKELLADVKLQNSSARPEPQSYYDAVISPWALIVIGDDTRPMICDIPTQRFFRVPADITVTTETLLHATSARGMVLLGLMCTQSLASPKTRS